MTPAEFRAEILRPWLLALAPVIEIPHSVEAENLLLAIAIQESALEHRYQVTTGNGYTGPARGWWQFEVAGVRGVLDHERTSRRSASACKRLHVVAMPTPVWRAIEGHDGLAVAFARLLLWSDPAPLPRDEDAAWDCYKRNWRPGKPDRWRWAMSWSAARA